MSQFRDEIESFHELGAEVLGVSVDSPHSHRVFAEMHGFNFPLVSDWHREITDAYDVRNDGGALKGICFRTVYVIGRDGKIRYAWQQIPRGPLPDNEEIRQAIRAIGA